MQSTAAALTAAMFPLPTLAQNALRATGYLRTNWNQDPFAYGSYSYVAKGARKRDHSRLAEPINDTVFFAGEACHPAYNSTVHAAYESGIMTAESVLETDKPSIAIIGAGISGLAAAHTLAQAGRNVVVLEARDRIGGRIWTSTDLATPVDLGASWIHGTTDNPLTKLADQSGLERVVTDESYAIRGNGGVLLDDYPDWMDEVANVQHSAGTELKNLNQLAYLIDHDYDGDEVIFPQGYAQILDTLSGDYDLRLNHTVSAISMTDAGVSIMVGDADLAFDAVIVTLPLGVLKKEAVQFSPPLPDKKRKAISRLGMGLLDKLYLQFDSVFWDKDVTWLETPETGLPQGQFNQWLNIYKYTGAPIVMAFNGATPAKDLAGLSDPEIVSRGLSALQRAYPQ